MALIPARAGSKRVPGKNIRPLAGHPVIAYTIAAARESGVFAAVVVSTDDERYAEIARHYGAEAPFLRPAPAAGDVSPDIDWVEHALAELGRAGRTFDAFSLLRPTNPFRSAFTIRRAWQAFAGDAGADSLRAVEPCRQHPAKMWLLAGERMTPLWVPDDGAPPAHSRPYQALPPVYVQNASLEIAWTRVVTQQRSISGGAVMPFLTEGYEGLDLNEPLDWEIAEQLLQRGQVRLPRVPQPPVQAPQAVAR